MNELAAIPPAPSAVAVLGEGDMPAELERMNWGATLLTGWWLLLHGLWLWWLIDLALLYGWLVALTLMRRQTNGSMEESMILVAGMVYWAISWLVSLWFGRHANARVWRRHAVRLARTQSGRPVAGYVRAQRWWTIAAVCLFALGQIGLVMQAIRWPARVVGGVPGAVTTIVMTIVFVGAAYLWNRRLVTQASHA